MRSRIKKKESKNRNSSASTIMQKKGRKTNQAELYTVTKSQDENYILKIGGREKITKISEQSPSTNGMEKVDDFFLFLGANVINDALFRCVNYGDKLLI